MLEFQEDFFDAEIREGFFVDQTMKTVWAAELEILQTIAEICDRHGLTWYAGFGTLLGAIRHEGFIPWDDDMDIMLLREDYMKLMKILPKELPKGYRFRSPFSEEGYTEYHTCIINGSGISIEPEFLRKFHNCPFVVGLDIFPLDYLPRDKNERYIQKNLFLMAARVTQMARNLLGGFDIEDDDKDKGREGWLKELQEGMKDLEELCKVKLDHSLVESEQWQEVMTQAWKLANELAMMYDRREGDDIVMYGDYATREYKIYPKSWFSEVYGATFENFMLPIPNGYEGFLRTIYGNYHTRIKGVALHNYPYYAEQLGQLRQYMKSMEGHAERAGLIEVQDSEAEVSPAGWKDLMNGRKVILFEDDVQLHIDLGEKVLDKLEKTLETFYQKRDKIVLWWRVKPKVKDLLTQFDPELAERYSKIREKYIQGGWGILDESSDADRAAEQCDAYYGDVGYILQPLQKKKKPILLIDYGEEKKEEEPQTC